MNNHDRINSRMAMDHVTASIRYALQRELVDNDSIDLDKAKEVIADTLKDLSYVKKITDGFSIGRVDTMWNNWSTSEKLKWNYCNLSCPDIAEDTRRLVDRANDLVQSLVKIIAAGDIRDDPPSVVDYPEWAVRGPKTIIITDMKIKLRQSIDYINVNMDIAPREGDNEQQ